MNLENIGNQQICEESPCGENIRYEAEFEELQKEIEKLSSPSASGTVDWQRVQDLSIDILATKSKDLLVAVYLAVALFYNHKEDGLLKGTHLILDLLKNFWDCMFPPKKRIKGRVSILEWWRDKLEKSIENSAPLALPSSHYNQLLSDLEEIEKFLENNLKNGLSILTLKRILEKVVQVSDAKDAIQEQPVRQEDNKPQSAQLSSDQPTAKQIEFDNIEGFNKTFNHILSDLKKTASRLMQLDFANPLAYKIWRSSIWLPILTLPTANNNQTKIPDPQSQIVSALQNLEDNREWKALVEMAESRLSQYPFWLDLNRYSYVGLRGLGTDYIKAADVVHAETASLLLKLPGLLNLTFSNGLPFASHATVSWLNEIVAPSPAQEEIHDIEKTNEEGELKSDSLSKAKEFASSGNMLQAISIMQRAIDSSKTGRHRFSLLVGLVEMLGRSKDSTLVYAHCEDILSDIDRFCMEKWEPKLAFKGLKAVWQCYSQSRQTEKKKKANEILMIMSRIDLPTVMSMLKH